MSDSESDLNVLLCVGDVIRFNYFGNIKQGAIKQIGNHGYWIDSTCGVVGSGSIRCDFSKAVKIDT